MKNLKILIIRNRIRLISYTNRLGYTIYEIEKKTYFNGWINIEGSDGSYYFRASKDVAEKDFYDWVEVLLDWSFKERFKLFIK